MSAPIPVKTFMYLQTSLIVISCLLFFPGCATQNEHTNVPTLEVVKPKEEKNVAVEESLHCISCHKKSNVAHHLNVEWQTNKHAVMNVGCKDCHAVSPEFDKTEKESFQKKETSCSDKGVQRMVSPQICGRCHMKQYNEFMQSSHSSSWDSVVDFQKNVPFSSDNLLTSCESCHTIQFKCNSCHTQHVTGQSHIKSPAVCGVCHTGSDHPQYEIYMNSKHGLVSSAIRSAKEGYSKSAYLSSPVCVTCHMPDGTHDTRFRLSGKMGGKSPYSEKEEEKGFNKEDSWKEKNDMLVLCNKCHSPAFSKDALVSAKNAQKVFNTVVKEAEELVLALDREKLLLPGLTIPLDSSYPEHAYFTGEYPLHSTVSKAEGIFIRLTKRHAAIAGKALHHMNVNYAYSHCWPEMLNDLRALKNEANNLRQEAEINRKMKIKLR